MTNNDDQTWMGFARLFSKQSHDLKTQVGAIIVNEATYTPIASGYNHFLKEGIDSFSDEKYDYVVHAEAECFMMFNSLDYEPHSLTMYVTLEPCKECAKLIVNSSVIKRVVYLNSKPKGSGVALLRELGVTVDLMTSEDESNGR